MNDADLRATFSRKARKCMEQFEAGLVMQRLKGMIEESIGGQSLRNS
jgi:hypothetical protein